MQPQFFTHSNMKTNLQDFKEFCDEYDREMLESNGRDHCKNCGLDGGWLYNMVKGIVKEEVLKRRK